jgi:hypothetical protein
MIIDEYKYLVLRPITNDEEFASMTKEVIEEKKRATLDYDSYRRMASSNGNAG